MKDRIWLAACLCAALAWASVVTFALQPRTPEAKDPPPPRLRVSVAPAPAAVAPAAPVQAVEKLQTKRPEKLKERAPVKTAEKTKAETPKFLQAETVIEANATLPPQPALATLPQSTATGGLPLIGQALFPPVREDVVSQQVEPAPPADAEMPLAPANGVSTSYPNVKPFGRSAVFALLLDHEGTVLDVRIVIPSETPLTDLTYAMALRAGNVKLDPPLAPGELRWHETKFDYRLKQENILP